MKSNSEILKFAFPAIIENFLQMLMGLSDTFLVSRVGLMAVAAVSLANNIIIVYQALFIALATIVSSLLARKLAEGHPEKVQALVNSAVKLTVIVSLIFGLISFILARPILWAFGARGQVLRLSIEYLSLVGGLIVLLGIMTTFAAFLRARGDSRTPMWVSLFANLLNLIFAASFILIFHWGVLGVASATVLARLIACLILYQKLRNERPNRQFIRQKTDRELIHLTIPASGERLAMRLGDLLIMAIIIHFGDRVFAGNAIGESITQFNYMPAFGMATVTVILVAQELGQRDFEAIKSYVKRSYWLSSIMTFAVALIIFLLSFWLNPLFTHDAVAIHASSIVIIFALIASFFITGNTTYTAAFQGLGNARLPFYATSIGMFVLRILLGSLFGIVFKLGLEGVWIGVTLDNLFRFIFLKWRFDRFMRQQEG